MTTLYANYLVSTNIHIYIFANMSIIPQRQSGKPERPAAWLEAGLPRTHTSGDAIGRAARSIASTTHFTCAVARWPREASPTAAIIDSQSVKSAEKDPMRVDGGLTW